MRKVKLYNWELEIREVPRLEIEEFMGTKETWGCIDYVTKKILLRKDVVQDIKRQTLIHELTHAIKYYLGYGKLDEENICNFMGAHLDVIHDIVEGYFNENNKQH